MEGELYCTVLEDLKHWRIDLAVHLVMRYGLARISVWSRLFCPLEKPAFYSFSKTKFLSSVVTNSNFGKNPKNKTKNFKYIFFLFKEMHPQKNTKHYSL